MIDYHNQLILNTESAIAIYVYGNELKDPSTRLTNEQVFEKALKNNENFSGSEYDTSLDVLQSIFTDFKSYENIDNIQEYYEISNKTTTEEIDQNTYQIYGLNYDEDKPEDEDDDDLEKEYSSIERNIITTHA